MRPALVLVSLALSSVVLAAPTDANLQLAKEHFRKGTQLYDLGQYLDAATEYQAAFKLSDRPGFLFNIAQAYRLAGKHQDAIAAYRGFLRREPSTQQRADAEAYIAELTRKIEQQAAEQERERERERERARQAELAAKPANPIESSPASIAVASAPETKPKPLYKRGVFWGVLIGSVAVVAAGVTLGVVFGTPAPNPKTTMQGAEARP